MCCGCCYARLTDACFVLYCQCCAVMLSVVVLHFVLASYRMLLCCWARKLFTVAYTSYVKQCNNCCQPSYDLLMSLHQRPSCARPCTHLGTMYTPPRNALELQHALPPPHTASTPAIALPSNRLARTLRLFSWHRSWKLTTTFWPPTNSGPHL
jgi:hypothetical protein